MKGEAQAEGGGPHFSHCSRTLRKPWETRHLHGIKVIARDLGILARGVSKTMVEGADINASGELG